MAKKRRSRKGLAKIRCMQRYYRKHAPKRRVVTRGVMKRLHKRAASACKVGR